MTELNDKEKPSPSSNKISRAQLQDFLTRWGLTLGLLVLAVGGYYINIPLFGFSSQHISLVSLVIMAVIECYLYYKKQGYKIAADWLKYIDKFTENIEDKSKEKLIDYLKITIDIEPAFQERLREQFSDIICWICLHLEKTKYFYAHYYMCLRMATYTGIVAGLAFIPISKVGFDQADGNHIALFLVTASASTIFTIVLKVFDLDANRSENQTMFLNYLALHNEVLTYGVTMEDFNKRKVLPKEFIHYLDKKMKELNNIAIKFEASYLPDFKKIPEELGVQGTEKKTPEVVTAGPSAASVWPEEKEELERVLETAKANYGNYPNVMGVTIGTKFTANTPSDEVGIVFYVSKKEDKPERMIPPYIYGRFEDGRVDRQKMFKTDVIELGEIKIACRAGSQVSNVRTKNEGTITLFFRNKHPSDPKSYYILTCSHVVGNMETTAPAGDFCNLTSPGCPGAAPFAVTLRNTLVRPNEPFFDLALAKVSARALDILRPNLTNLDGAVTGANRVLRQILPSGEISLWDQVECVGTKTGHLTGTIHQKPLTLRLEAYGKYVNYSEIFILPGTKIQDGDSGGLVYRHQAALGIIVACSKVIKNVPIYSVLFQPLDKALRQLCDIHPKLELKIF